MPDDLVGLSPSDIFLTDWLAYRRHLHGAITPEQLEKADAMATDAFITWALSLQL